MNAFTRHVSILGAAPAPLCLPEGLAALVAGQGSLLAHQLLAFVRLGFVSRQDYSLAAYDRLLVRESLLGLLDLGRRETLWLGVGRRELDLLDNAERFCVEDLGHVVFEQGQQEVEV